MKNFFKIAILLSVFGLCACGGSSTNADDEQDCAENPDLCPSVDVEPTDDAGL